MNRELILVVVHVNRDTLAGDGCRSYQSGGVISGKERSVDGQTAVLPSPLAVRDILSNTDCGFQLSIGLLLGDVENDALDYARCHTRVN